MKQACATIIDNCEACGCPMPESITEEYVCLKEKAVIVGQEHVIKQHAYAIAVKIAVKN